MIYNIFRNNTEVASIKPYDSSELIQKSQTDDYISLGFELVDYIDFQIGDYIYYPQTQSTYVLNDLPTIDSQPNKYVYDCIFQGLIHELPKTKLFLDTPKETGGFYRDYEFSLTGDEQTFLEFVVSNLNRGNKTYFAGESSPTNFKTINFNNVSIYEAILIIAKEFGFDWNLNGNVLNFTEKVSDYAYIFQTGRRLGFTKLSRLKTDESNLVTVVYGYGSSENIPPRINTDGTSYDGENLTSNRLFFNGEDGLSKLSKSTDKYGEIESVQEFDIKPEYTGVVTSLGSDVFTFFDTGIDFDINEHLASGLSPKIKFLDGLLIGLEFEIVYDHSTKKITMVAYEDESGTYPNATIKAGISDRYKIFDIIMPSAYIESAENRLQEATQAYLDKYSKPLNYYEGEVDKQYIGLNGITLKLYDIIRVISGVYRIDNLYSIKELRQKITDPTDYVLKFGDLLPSSTLTKLKLANFENDQKIYNITQSTVNNTDITNVIGETVAWE